MDVVGKQTEAFLEALAHVLKEARLSANLSQIELAARSGLSQAHISLIEKNLRSPSAETIKRISIALNTPASGLIAAAESATKS